MNTAECIRRILAILEEREKLDKTYDGLTKQVYDLFISFKKAGFGEENAQLFTMFMLKELINKQN